MFTRLSVDCMMKGDTPMAMTGRSTLGSRRRCLAWMVSLDRFPVRNLRTHRADTAWERMVARAAPCTPISKPKIKTGSSTMLHTAPMMTVSMETVEKPWVVMKLLSPRENCTAMVPQR